MFVSVPLADLKTVDVLSLAPGDFFLHAPRRAGEPISCGIRCADYESEKSKTILVTGTDGILSLRSYPEDATLPGIKLDVENPRFEIDYGVTIEVDEAPGLLLANAGEAAIGVMFKTSKNTDLAYLRFQDWSVSRYPLPDAAVFNRWRLIGDLAGDRGVALFQGRIG